MGRPGLCQIPVSTLTFWFSLPVLMIGDCSFLIDRDVLGCAGGRVERGDEDDGARSNGSLPSCITRTPVVCLAGSTVDCPSGAGAPSVLVVAG